jgi:hypothetical protein
VVAFSESHGVGYPLEHKAEAGEAHARGEESPGKVQVLEGAGEGSGAVGVVGSVGVTHAPEVAGVGLGREDLEADVAMVGPTG